MPSTTTLGGSLWHPGWTGNIQIRIGGDTLTVTPSDLTSPARVAESLVSDARLAWPLDTWGWAFDATGCLTITGTTAFQLLGAGNTAERLGLTVPSSSLTSHTGTATAGLWAVWVLYTDDHRQHDRATESYGGAVQGHCPAADLRQPKVQALVSTAQTVAWAEAWESVRYPGKLDLVQAGEALVTYRVAKWRANQHDAVGKYYKVSLEVVR